MASQPATRVHHNLAILLIASLVQFGICVCTRGEALNFTVRPADSLRSIQQNREAIEHQIQEVEAAQEKANDGDDAAERDERLRLLKSLQGLSIQQQTWAEERQKLEQEKQDVERATKSLEDYGLEEPKPYSFVLKDDLEDQLEVEKERQKALKTDVKTGEQLLKDARTESKHGKEVDAATKSADHESDSFTSAAALRAAESRAKVEAKQLQISVLHLRTEVSDLRKTLLEKKLKAIGKDVEFSAQDRDAELGRLAAIETRLRRERRAADTRLQETEVDPRKPEEGGEKKTEEKPAATSSAEAEGFRQRSEAVQAEIVVLEQELGVLSSLRKSWRRRYELATGTVEATKATQWLDDLDELADQLDDNSHSLEQRRAATVEQMAKAGDATAGSSQKQRAVLQQLGDVCESSLHDLRAAERMLERFRAELKAKVGKRSAFGPIGTLFNSLFGTEVVSDEDKKVTLGTLLVLLLYVVVGGLAAWVLSRLVGRRLLPRLGLHPGTIQAIKSIVFYTLCTLFGVLAFRLLQIPLAAFAFLGGAAAIAVGFGSQDIMNNFMSGIILLTEQPIRVGDVVDLSGTRGVVMHIGLRSTRLQTDDNYELIVPNKTLLDEQVLNLTLSDNLVRTVIEATLDRELNIEKTKREILEIAFSHPLVVKSPRPVVIVKEVDTYWLIFEVHLWLEYTNFIKCAVIRSEVLEVIGDRFRPKEEGTSGEATSETSAEAPAEPSAIPEATPQLSKSMLGRAIRGARVMRIRD